MQKRRSYEVGNGLEPEGKRNGSDNDNNKGTPMEPFLLEEPKVGLQRTVTLMNAIGIIVGSIIGSGIFLTPGGVYTTAQDPYLTLGVWAGCGLFSLVGAICFAELGTCVTKSGGDYAYILEAFGPFAGFMTLWVTVLVLRPTTAAIVAITFAEYVIKPFFLACDLPPEVANSTFLFASACLCLLTAVNCISVKGAMKIQDIFTAAKLVALAIIILTGFYYLISWNVSGATGAGADKLATNVFSATGEFEANGGFDKPFTITALSLSFYNGLFAYAGWNYLNFVTEELIDPYKNLPRAIYVGLPLVTIIYVLANVSYFIVLSPVEMTLPAIGSTFGSQAFSIYFQWAIPVFVALSTFGGVNGTLFTTARMFFAGAENGHMPEILACVHVKRCTPVPALIFSCVASIAVMLTGDVGSLLVYVSFVLWVSTGVSVAALVVLRVKQPDLERPIRVSLFWPYLYCVLTFLLVAASIYEDPKNTAIGVLITLTGVPVYLIFVWWPERIARKKGVKPKPIPGVAAMTKFLQKILNVVPPEKID